MLSELVGRVRPSPTVAVTARVEQMRREGREVIGLGAGEPDFDTPPHIVEAAKAAMDRGATRYTAPDGIMPLKEAIAAKFHRDNGLNFDPATEISVSAGGKQAIFNAILASVGPGDEVLIPAPYWVSYPDIVRLAGGTPVLVDTDAQDGYRLRPEALAAAITPRSKWLILNSPSNPTGAGLSSDDLSELADVLAAHPQIWVMSDEIYEHIVYDDFRHHSIAQFPTLAGRCLVINGVSKAYAMTGWRIGYAAGPAELIAGMRTIQSQSTTNPSSISQHAAVAALEGPQDYLNDWCSVFQTRRDLVASALNAIDGVTCPVPAGAFYVYPAIDGLMGRKTPNGVAITDDLGFAEALLNETGVAVVAGTAFGKGPAFRVSFAASNEVLTEACTRISAFCERLS